MEENQFLKLQNEEQSRLRDESVDFLVQRVKELVAITYELKRDIRTVREDLRNLDKLRPLRTIEEKV